MKKEYSNKFRNYLKAQIVVTINELSIMSDVSVRTVQRKLKQWKVIRSYDYNGRYFALDEVACFNNLGIWEHDNIHFSKYGNLKNTLIGIIADSEYGMRAVDIRNTLGLDTRSFLYHYTDCQEIKREKVGSHYVYFSANQTQYAIQFTNRKKIDMQQSSPVLKGSTGIVVLVETIKHPDLSTEDLSKHLRWQGIRIEPKIIIEFYKFHGIEKKTNSEL